MLRISKIITTTTTTIITEKGFLQPAHEPVWPSVREASGWQAEVHRFEFASALLSLQRIVLDAWTLSYDIAPAMNKTLKWLKLLPKLMQNQSGGDSEQFDLHSSPSPSPPPPPHEPPNPPSTPRLFPHLLGSRSPPVPL